MFFLPVTYYFGLLQAGCSPIFGLFCAIVPNVTYALLGTSHESAVGAMALVSDPHTTTIILFLSPFSHSACDLVTGGHDGRKCSGITQFT